jgi:hypothetical protein
VVRSKLPIPVTPQPLGFCKPSAHMPHLLLVSRVSLLPAVSYATSIMENQQQVRVQISDPVLIPLLRQGWKMSLHDPNGKIYYLSSCDIGSVTVRSLVLSAQISACDLPPNLPPLRRLDRVFSKQQPPQHRVIRQGSGVPLQRLHGSSGFRPQTFDIPILIQTANGLGRAFIRPSASLKRLYRSSGFHKPLSMGSNSSRNQHAVHDTIPPALNANDALSPDNSSQPPMHAYDDSITPPVGAFDSATNYADQSATATHEYSSPSYSGPLFHNGPSTSTTSVYGQHFYSNEPAQSQVQGAADLNVGNDALPRMPNGLYGSHTDYTTDGSSNGSFQGTTTPTLPPWSSLTLPGPHFATQTPPHSFPAAFKTEPPMLANPGAYALAPKPRAMQQDPGENTQLPGNGSVSPRKTLFYPSDTDPTESEYMGSFPSSATPSPYDSPVLTAAKTYRATDYAFRPRNTSQAPQAHVSTTSDPYIQTVELRTTRGSVSDASDNRADSDLDSLDRYIIKSRKEGLSFRMIKERGNLHVAESTLRGRYRGLTKPPEQRVRRPAWSTRDVSVSPLGR